MLGQSSQRPSPLEQHTLGSVHVCVQHGGQPDQRLNRAFPLEALDGCEICFQGCLLLF
jgi:hypothetical protein